MPGDNVSIEATLDLAHQPWKKALRFAIREGGRTIGSGVVAKIVGVSFFKSCQWLNRIYKMNSDQSGFLLTTEH